MYWTTEFGEEEVLAFFDKHGFKDCDDDVRLRRIVQDSKRVGPKRQLGDWIQVDVDAERKVVSCNCEDFNFDARCFHQALFEVLQLNRLPDCSHEYDNEQWDEIRKKCIKVLKATYLL